VAIPHTFVPGLDRVITVFGRSKGGIDFEAHDQAPVFFVVLFVVPKSEDQLHLKTLAAIAKMFSNVDIRQSLASAADAGKSSISCRSVLDSGARGTSAHGIGLGIVIDARQAEAKELEELALVAVEIGHLMEILRGDLIPGFSDGRLDFRSHLPIVDPDAALAVELRRASSGELGGEEALDLLDAAFVRARRFISL